MNCCICLEEINDDDFTIACFNCPTCNEGKICDKCSESYICKQYDIYDMIRSVYCYKNNKKEKMKKNIFESLKCPCCRSVNYKHIMESNVLHIISDFNYSYHYKYHMGKPVFKNILNKMRCQ